MARHGYDYKEWVVRHGRASRRIVDAIEKAIETKVRQAARREVREAQDEASS